MAVALFVRLQHFRQMHPYFCHQDEIRQGEGILKMFRNHTLAPELFINPHLHLYFNGAFFAGFFAKHNLREAVAENSMAPIWDAAQRLAPESAETIFLQRGISLLIGLVTVFGVWLAARFFFSEGFALLAGLIFALSPLPVSLSVLAKPDSFQECAVVFNLYFALRVIRHGKTRDYILTALCAAACFTTKNNLAPLILLILPVLIRAKNEKQTLAQVLADKRPWLTFAAAGAATFLFSPWYFLNYKEAFLQMGYLRAVTTFNSYNRFDPHYWWLGRYPYSFVVLLPFLAGITVYLFSLAGFIERTFRAGIDHWSLLIANLVLFLGFAVLGFHGSTPLNWFMPAMVFFALFSVWPVALLWSKGWKKVSLGLATFLAVTAGAQAQNYYAVNFQAFDLAGPRLVKEIPAGSKILGFSVYLPGPALYQFNYLRAWPQNLDRAAVESFDPDYILVYRSDFAGFEKYYRDTLPINGRLQELLSGQWGYRVKDTLEVSYPGDFLFQWLDPEFVIKLIVLEKVRG